MKIKKTFCRLVTTRCLGPTTRRGSRVKAISGKNSAVVPWNHELSPQENHFAAVKALCEKYGLEWGRDWGVAQNQSGYCFFPLENGYGVD